MTLPTIDLFVFAHGNPSESHKVAVQLLDAFSQHGFVRIVGHGVPERIVTKLFEWVRDLGGLIRFHGLMIA